MGSLCNFRPMGHPRYLKLSTMPTNKQVLYPFHRPNITGRLSRTGNKIPCLVLAQKANNNGRNPEENLGSSDNSLNVGGNGILPKNEKVAQRKRGTKSQEPSILGETLAIVLEIVKFFVSMFIYGLQRLGNSINFEFNLQNMKHICVGILYTIVWSVFFVPVLLCWSIFWFVLEKAVKILAVVWIMSYAYVYLFRPA